MSKGNAATRLSAKIQRKIPPTNAPNIWQDRQDGSLTVTIGNTDLPAFVSSGILYVQAPLPHIFKAFAEDLSAFVGDLEIRVSDTRGAPLPLDRNGRPVYRKSVVVEGVV